MLYKSEDKRYPSVTGVYENHKDLLDDAKFYVSDPTSWTNDDGEKWDGTWDPAPGDSQTLTLKREGELLVFDLQILVMQHSDDDESSSDIGS